MSSKVQLPPLSPQKVNSDQIYEGHKFYWRQRLNVDINMIIHHHTGLLEVIPYDSDNCNELDRLYLSFQQISSQTSVVEELGTKVAQLKKELSRDRFKTLPTDAELISKCSKDVYSNFVLNRLIAVTENGKTCLQFNALSSL